MSGECSPVVFNSKKHNEGNRYTIPEGLQIRRRSLQKRLRLPIKRIRSASTRPLGRNRGRLPTCIAGAAATCGCSKLSGNDCATKKRCHCVQSSCLARRPSSIRPTRPLIINLGSAYSQLNQHEAAIISYDGAIALNPDCAAVARYNRGNALHELR